MPVLINLDHVHKAYGGRVLLDDASVAFTDAMKVGVIGRNGAGKTTLCRLVIGEEEPESGSLWRHDDLRLAHLRQHDPFLPEETALAFLMRDSGQPQWRCAEVAARFAVKGERLTQVCMLLSGGWRTRLKLAALLLAEPNFLVLDEPTNFLDLRTQMLLERFLADWRGGALIVSHDREFLTATCDHTLEVARGGVELHPGKVGDLLEHQRQRREHAEKQNATVEAKRRQLERFIIVNRANANTAPQARSKARMLEKLETIDIAQEERQARLRVPQVEARRGWALRVQDLAIGYPDRQVANGISLEIEHGSRIAVVGDNGQGKTTFLRTIAGTLAALGGTYTWATGCSPGLYAQHVYSSLSGNETVFERILAAGAGEVTTQEAQDVAGGFLFSGDDAHKPLTVLSGGERARVCLACLLVGRASVLILDEPSNHLDVESVAALAEALAGFKGTILFTSHDRTFVRRLATGVIEVRDGGVAVYPADYETYLWRVDQEIANGLRENTAAKPAEKRDTAAIGRKRWELEKQVANAEKNAARAEAALTALRQELERSGADAAQALALHEKITAAEATLEKAETRWYAVQEELHNLERK